MIENPILPSDIASGDPVALVESVIVTLINVFYVVGVIIFFFMLIFGGIQWISSSGDKQSVAEARERLMHAVIGLVILLAVFALVSILETLLGVDILIIDVGGISLSGSSSSPPPCIPGQPC